jgi:hypothetical protein
MAQAGNHTLATPHFQLPPPAPHPHEHHAKPSKGIKAFPEGWRKVLNHAKDIVRASVLLQEPFPGPPRARVIVNECFHEAVTTECDLNKVILEPGTFGIKTIIPLNGLTFCQLGHKWGDPMMTIVSYR